MTDRKSPVPSEAINISHLPKQSGNGVGGGITLSLGQYLQTPSGDSLYAGLQGWTSQANTANGLSE